MATNKECLQKLKLEMQELKEGRQKMSAESQSKFCELRELFSKSLEKASALSFRNFGLRKTEAPYDCHRFLSNSQSCQQRSPKAKKIVKSVLKPHNLSAFDFSEDENTTLKTEKIVDPFWEIFIARKREISEVRVKVTLYQLIVRDFQDDTHILVLLNLLASSRLPLNSQACLTLTHYAASLHQKNPDFSLFLHIDTVSCRSLSQLAVSVAPFLNSSSSSLPLSTRRLSSPSKIDDTLRDASKATDTSTPHLQIDSTENVETQSSSSLNPKQQQTKRPLINQSIVWEHFKKVEPIDKENPKASCNYCLRLIGCHYRRNGTSSMMTHLTSGCQNSPLKKSKVTKGQTLLQMSLMKSTKGTSSNQVGFMKFDQERCRTLLTEYFIESERPFRHVESPSFRKLMNGIEPRFKLPCRITLQKDCLKMYEKEKLVLKGFLSGKRVCLTTDTWTSIQNLSYMCVTAHLIDSDWKMHKKIIKFCQICGHKGESIGRKLEATLLEWGTESVFTITVDNVLANKWGIDHIKGRMQKKPKTVLGGEFIHMRCAAHILNIVVKEDIDDLKDCVGIIKNGVKYVRSLPSRFAKFKSCIVRENIKCGKMVCLDVAARWNSTYYLLSTTEKYQKTFDLLGEDDGHLFIVPSITDWENVRAFVKFLKVFYDATLKFSGSTHVTSNLYFMQLCIIQHTLNAGCLSLDPILSAMNDGIGVLVGRCNGSKWADKIKGTMKDLLKRLMDQYNKFQMGSLFVDVNITSSNDVYVNVACNNLEDNEAQFRKMSSQHVEKVNDLQCRSEFDRYLHDGPVVETKEFDILA
ncbi:zinc finger BED domain-containing protein RICESLEEPER 2-like [Corylus avellana]|uniref:zinc finger BED domain-containing protein RICESLEEPER 2-like n=1 Tax=Corylus avellana TaxID=13451 RepID=UPI002869EFE1|nr:zinc finger BED domain-containing protein RICESLEEPER 2-like [Corylus avellana]